MNAKPTLHIDGNDFATLSEFFEQVSLHIIPGAHWGKNLNAFNDILRGGFGTPDDGFIFRWDNHEISKQRLGYDETARQLRAAIDRNPASAAQFEPQLADALRHEGPTIFDWLVEKIRIHGPGGEEAEDGIELLLA